MKSSPNVDEQFNGQNSTPDRLYFYWHQANVNFIKKTRPVFIVLCITRNSKLLYLEGMERKNT